MSISSAPETPFPKPVEDDGSPPHNIVENINSDTSHSTASTGEHSSVDAKHVNPNLTMPSSSSQDHDEAAQIAKMESSKYIVKQLKELYRKHVVDAERRYHLHYNFRLPTDGDIRDSEFDAAPMVLLIGQYSTGKTTFISHLLGESFPGMHIGPEPTTDKFTALFHSGERDQNATDLSAVKFEKKFHQKDQNSDGTTSSRRTIETDGMASDSGKLIKGNTLTVTPNLPFSSLSQFGSAFLNHFVGSSTSSPLLKRLIFVDTPGVLSGEKQRINRTYDFGQVCKWFADRADLILLLFDAHKLDISDELQDVIDTIRPHNDDKIRCVLNKADAVTREQLVRVYGSLMWSMGKIFDSPEVIRVYTGSYWNGPLLNGDFADMFERDEQLLVRELVDLPRCVAERKVNQMVNRIRLVKVHVCILGTLRNMTPRLFGKSTSREQILDDLEAIMEKVRMKYDLSKGDMPRTNEFKRCLEHFLDFSVFPPINNELIQCLDRLIQEDIPKIVGGADVVTDRFEILGKASIQRGNANDKSEKMSQSCNDIANKAKISTTIKYVTVLFIMVLFAVGVIKNDWTALQSSYSFSEFHDVSLQLLEQVMHAIKVALGGFMSTLTVLKDTLF
mmetsp:Transcript_8487/g.17691  ORF Transcript_8487/g.17691 Transcript_8487/m.17691 type:complete len:617 (+) Transcript_8487:33-1883(+)